MTSPETLKVRFEKYQGNQATMQSHQSYTTPLETDGGGGNSGGMNERVARLEERLDSTLPNLATKADLGELKAEIEKGQKENRAWMLATVIALFLGILAVGNFMASALKATPNTPPPQAAQAPTALQPIVISVPIQTPPVAPPAAPAAAPAAPGSTSKAPTSPPSDNQKQ